MSFGSLRSLFATFGMTPASTKRVAKARNGWGIETEMLEDRALLSAAGKCANMADPNAAAEVAKVQGKKVEIPNVGGSFTVQITSPQTPLGPIDVTDSDVNFTQTGKKVTGNFEGEGATAGIVAKLKGKTLNQALVKATVNIFGQSFTAKLTVTYDSADHFSGNATIKKFGNIVINIQGTRNQG